MNGPAPTVRAVEDILRELVECASLLEDLTFRSTKGGMEFTTDGLCGLNLLALHMRGLAMYASDEVVKIKEPPHEHPEKIELAVRKRAT